MRTAFESAAAAAFADRIPVAGTVSAEASTASGDTGEAVVATYAGQVSARMAVQLLDPHVLVDGSADAPMTERLRDGLEAAAAALGVGTLTDVSTADASEIFSDPDAEVFDLRDGQQHVIGRIAVRITARPDQVPEPSRRLHRIAGVEMDLAVELGRTRMAVRDVLTLEPGRIVELDRSAGAPADVKLNGRTIAHGEIVVVDGDYAVRITRILESTEV